MRVTRQQLRLAVVVPVLLVVAAAIVAPSWGQSVPPIAVRVSPHGDVSRREWPVQVSVPFPAGALREVAAIQATDSAGVVLPVQARALAPWPDGSVRWALVDTRVVIEPGGQAGFEVRLAKDEPSPRSASIPGGGLALRVEERDDAFVVDTGALRFQVPKKHFAVLEKVEAGGAALRDGMTSFVIENGGRLPASAPRRVRLVERGPLRALLEMEGDYGNGVDYLVRIEAYSGQSFVRIRHSFTNRRAGTYVSLERIAVEWPLDPAAGSQYTFGVDGNTPLRGRVPDGGLRFYQPDNTEYRVGDAKESGRLDGWWELSRGPLSVGIGVRWFWQEYPQAVELRADRLVYDLWAPEATPAKVGMGAAKTHEFFIWVNTAGDIKHGADLRAIQLPVALVDPGWLARTGALPGAVIPGPRANEFLRRVHEGFAQYMQRNASERWDDRGEVHCRPGVAARPRVGAYGMWNWGDWNFPGYQDDTKGCDAWGNLEYDTTLVLALLFAATGDPLVHEAMVAAARHFMDVDTIHFSDRHPEWVGMNHPKNPLHFTFELGGVDLGHTWTEGLVAAYYLTGDERALAAARGIADYLVRRVDSVTLAGNPRQWGWPQIALLAVYEATRDESYRRAAVEYAHRGMRAHPPDRLDEWKLGILADALAHTHAVTRQQEIETWLRQYAGAVAQQRKRDARFYPAVAYVARLSNDAQLRDLALDRVRKLKPRGWGKPFTLDGRIGFRIHSLIDID